MGIDDPTHRRRHVIGQQLRYEVRERELWLLSDSDDALVSVRSDRVAPASVRVLPGSVSDGYRLARVAPQRSPPATRQAGRGTRGRPTTRTATRPTAQSSKCGFTDDTGYTRILVQVDGGVVMVSSQPLGASFPDGPNPAA